MSKHTEKYSKIHIINKGLLLVFLLIVSGILGLVYKTYAAQDLLEQAFAPAKQNDTIINLGNTKNAVGNEILREWVGVQDSLGVWCFVNGEKVTTADLQKQAGDVNVSVSSDSEKENFCQNVLWWDWKAPVLTTQAPLIVRIAKFLLRITMVLAITMVIFNGIMRIIESAKWAEVKDAKKNIMLIVGGILVALMSLGIITLISSLTVSSLSTDKLNTTQSTSTTWTTVNEHRTSPSFN